MTQRTPPERVAAIDLGSNSFHMVVARLAHGQLHRLDRLRERVAIGEGLGPDKVLQPEVQERALQCLERFGQIVRELPKGAVRVVGTDTLRRMRGRQSFMKRAQEVLRHPVEVISGVEEARLIYLGVSHLAPETEGRRLVVDIGGGSTECIIGERFEPVLCHSLYMGCVSWSQRYFKDGELTAKSMDKAIVAAHLQLRTMKRGFRALGWQTCLGASGTVKSVAAILRANGWTDDDVITRKGLAKVQKAIVKAGHVDKLDIPGMPVDRRPVLAGGVAILDAVLDSLAVEGMIATDGALRDGVLYDLLGRIQHEDVRDRTIRTFCERYHVDLAQAARVERTAADLFEQVREAWGLDADAKNLLSWAALLHEIGMSIAYASYRKHGAYLVLNADMPGFSREDQEMLSILLRRHRGEIKADLFEDLGSRAVLARRLCVLLRLAVCLNRSRSPRPPPVISVVVAGESLRLAFAGDWLARHALTRADLEIEIAALAALGITLEFG
jgi:exopolyphosphatase/guanosine-5'-triphosphate,3'-diphosphate pyrophosphatase